MSTQLASFTPRETIGVPAIWTFDGDEPMSNATSVDVLTTLRDVVDATICEHGGVLIRHLKGVTTAQDFEAVIEAVTPNLRDYIGGTSPRSVVRGKIMEATHVPPSWSIPLHQEMAYTKNPPDRIAFFCEKPAESGGHSTVGDMRRALDLIDPSVRNKFEALGLQLRRVLPSEDRLHLKPGVQKPWSEVFGTSDVREVDRIVADKNWKAVWRNDSTLELWQDLLPAVKVHPVTGESIWCNQAHFFSPICMINWARDDSRTSDYETLSRAKASHPEMLDNIFLGNGEAVSDEDASHVYSVLRSLEQPLLLGASDLLILDNIILAHGRTAFTGDRRILVAMSDRQGKAL